MKLTSLVLGTYDHLKLFRIILYVCNSPLPFFCTTYVGGIFSFLFLCLVRGSDYRHTALWSWEFHKSFWNVFHLEYVGIELGISFFPPPRDFICLLIYLLLVVLSLHCWAGYSLVAMRRLLVAVASLIAEHGL